MILRWLKMVYENVSFYTLCRGISGLGDLFPDAASTGWLAYQGQFVTRQNSDLCMYQYVFWSQWRNATTRVYAWRL